MTCRSEHPTRNNRAPALRLQHRLASISAAWVSRRIAEKNRRARERNRAIRKQRAARILTRRKVKAWQRDIRDLDLKLIALERKQQTEPTSVKAEDWDKLAEGKERKLQVIFGKKFPRDKWPAGVPYLNMIALAQHEATRKVARARKRPALKKAASKRIERNQSALVINKVTASPPIAPKSVEMSIWDSPASVQAEILRLEREYEKAEKQLMYLIRSRADPTSVSFEQWCNAVEGTDAAQKDPRIAGYMELARRRAMEEACDGWAYGRYFGS